MKCVVTECFRARSWCTDLEMKQTEGAIEVRVRQVDFSQLSISVHMMGRKYQCFSKSARLHACGHTMYSRS